MTDHQDFFEHAPCGYATLDDDGIIIAANQAFFRIVQRSHDETVGHLRFSSLLPGGDRIYFGTHFDPSLRMHREIHEIAFDLKRPSGERVPVLVSANVDLRDPNRPQVRLVVYEARDRRTYEQELLAARRAAEESEERARVLAETLQQTLIPPRPPQVPGLLIDGAYRPAGNGREVGGDFYDVFQIREGEWVVAIGDVCGKGAAAAALTAFVRHSIRFQAVLTSDPAEVLRRVNEGLLHHDSDRFCTAAVLRLKRDGSQWQARVAVAGHPLPLLRTGDTVRDLGVPGSLLGVLPEAEIVSVLVPLGVRDSVVLYTDGVTEARSGADLYGDDRLASLIARTGSEDLDPQATTAVILADVLAYQADVPRDDIAIVTLQPAG